MPQTIALPSESRSGELRVALDPVVARDLQALPGIELVIQSGCGCGAGFADEDYGATQVADSFHGTVENAVLTLKVNPPTLEEAGALPRGSVLLCIMSPFQNLAAIELLQERGITTLAMDLVPRMTRAQSMDVLSSQATVAGYKAALMAAELCPRLFPRMITAAGTLRPSRVMVIGAGVGGLQAIATCRRLGAQVEAYDIRRAAKEQIESLGATMIDTGVEAESHGGYARALTREERETQHDVLARHLREAHAVICAAAIPGRVAPRIITEDMVDGMMANTVIIDMAAETGGNCVLTKPGATIMHRDTVIVGPLNLPSRGAVHASEMYARNLWSLLQVILPAGKLTLDWNDPLVAGCRLTHAGELQHAPTRALRDDALVSASGADKENAVASGNAASASASSSGTAWGAGTVPGELAAGWLDDDPESADDGGGRATDGPAPDDRSDTGPDTARDVRHAAAAETSDSPQSGKRSGGAPPAGSGQPQEALPTDEPADDFTLIRGVGPALNNSLKAFGFHRFRQLAELDAQGIEQLEQQLELDGNILRDDWPGQARRLERSHWMGH